jgi:hypothetical protein
MADGYAGHSGRGKAGRSRGQLFIKTSPILVRLPPDELAALDRWIADQPPPVPTRPQALRRLGQLGLRARGSSRPPQPPTRPRGLAAPGLVWESSGGRWMAIWQAQTRFVRRGYPAKRVPLWAGADSASVPTSAEWKMISARCVTLQQETRDRRSGA